MNWECRTVKIGRVGQPSAVGSEEIGRKRIYEASVVLDESK